MYSFRPLIAITFLQVIFLSILAFGDMLKPHVDLYYVNNDDPERNGRSTPRSFVLPSTPAVALEHEQRKKFPTIRASYDQCLSKLIYLGYEIDDVDSTFNAKLIQAVIEFQVKNSIKVNGELDAETKFKIGC